MIAKYLTCYQHTCMYSFLASVNSIEECKQMKKENSYLQNLLHILSKIINDFVEVCRTPSNHDKPLSRVCQVLQDLRSKLSLEVRQTTIETVGSILGGLDDLLKIWLLEKATVEGDVRDEETETELGNHSKLILDRIPV